MNFYPHFIYFLISLGEIWWRKSLCNAGDCFRVLWKIGAVEAMFTYGHKWNLFHISCISHPVWMKFGTWDIQKNLTSDHEFRENQQSESYALVLFHWHEQNVTIPCHFQELLLFLSVVYFFQPPFSTNYSSILPHFILPSISWSTSKSCCFQVHVLGILFSSIFYTCPNQHNLFNLIVSVIVGFWTFA